MQGEAAAGSLLCAAESAQSNYRKGEIMKRTWWKESVIYQIYPRSFCDSNGDGIGDLQGITGKIGYLRELGIDVVWLSPVYQSPNDDNGYDISDYQKIMKEFGTMEDFDELLETAHANGIRIVMDLVVNHTSDEHAWFVESRSSRENPYRDYYIWREGKNGGCPNNWESNFSGPAWEYDANTDMYYLHLFSRKQPDLNWENEAVREEVYRMMRWWLDKGVDGFRMDVINLISKTPGLPDGEPIPGTPYGNSGPYTANGPRIHEFLQEMNRKALSGYDVMTVGETPGVTVELAREYTGEDRQELNMVFQFEHMDVDSENGTKWTDKTFDLVQLKAILAKWQTGLKGQGWNSLYWNNHDQPRVVSRFGNDGPYWEKSAKMLGTCLHMMQGTPYIYQGEEIGMTNVAFESIEEYRDIETLNVYREFTEERGVSPEDMMRYIHKKSRDNARTPMQWNGEAGGGFTAGTPWIAMNPNYKTINAEAQRKEPDSIFHYYQKLIRLRKEHLCIVYGDFTLLWPESKELFAYLRRDAEETLFVVCNFTENEVACTVPEEFVPEKGRILISNYADAVCCRDLKLRPYEAVVYQM